MYQDTYVEQVVKRTVRRQEITVKNILLVLLIFFALTTVFVVHIICPFLLIVFGILYYRQMCRVSTEYEYLYVQGTLEIDRVRFQSRRKNMAVINMPEVLTVAPKDSQKALAYDHGQMSVMHFESKDPQAQTFVLIARMKGKDKQVKIIWEPNQKLLEAMKSSIPDRIFYE